MFFPSCDCTKVEFDGIYVCTIDKGTYNLIMRAERGEFTLIDKHINYYFFRGDIDLKIENLVSVIENPSSEIINTSLVEGFFEKSLEEFCQNSNTVRTDFNAVNLYDLDYKSMKEITIRGKIYYFYVQKVKIKALKKEVENSPINRFYLDSNITLDKGSKTLTVYLATNINGL